jgi:hypothetical protein
VDNTATVKITKIGSDKTNRPPVIVWASCASLVPMNATNLHVTLVES